MEIVVTRIDNAIKVIPAPPYLVKYLQYTHRGMEMVGYQKETVYTKIQLHRQCEDGGIVTFRGFFQRIKALIEDNDDVMVVDDRRTPLPEIDKEAVLNINFRDHQIPLMVEILENLQHNDGIVNATGGAGKTFIIAAIYAAYNQLNTIVAVPLASVAKQTYLKLKELFPDKDIGLMGAGGSTVGTDLTVATSASLERCALEKCKLLMFDEVQGCTSQRMQDIIMSINAIRNIGVTATDSNLFNKADKVLTALYGDRLCEFNYDDAVSASAVVPGVVYMVRTPEQGRSWKGLDGKMKYGLKMHDGRNRLIGQIAAAVPDGWQCIAFIDHVSDHLVEVAKHMPAGTRWIHRESSKKKSGAFALSPKQQIKVMEEFANNEFKYLIGSDAIRAGISVDNVRCVIQCAGGCSEVELRQEAYRGSRILTEDVRTKMNLTPKTHFVLVDFTDEHDDALSNMSKNRRKIYEREGWIIRDVEEASQIDWYNYGQHEAKL